MPDTPNLLLIMTDQQRADALGCVGGWVGTPHLDRLAREGVLFRNCVTTSPVCVPARRNFATGHYCHNTGVWANGPTAMPPGTPTWMRAIQDAGYRNCVIGKTHWHSQGGDVRDREDLVRSYGFDDVDETVGPRAAAQAMCNMTERWRELGFWQAYKDDYADRFANEPWVVRPNALPLPEYYDSYVGRRAVEYLSEYEDSRPWFCWVSFGGPHEPWDTPEPYASRYDPAKMPEPRRAPLRTSDGAHGVLDRRLANRPAIDAAHFQRMRADYAGNVTLIDDWIGRMLAVLDERGQLDNTVIAFTSDHGEHNGDAGLIYKETFLDGAVRVPLIVRAPDVVQPGRRCDNPAEWSDVGPTLASYAGAQLDHPQFAQSVRPVLDATDAAHRPDALSEYAGEFMLLTEQWKIALNADGDCYMLFDRENDPNEAHNLAGSRTVGDIESKLRLRILERLAQSQLRST